MAADGKAVKGGNDFLGNVRRIVLVLSGKGGVGKSTVAVQLALALQHSGKKVGLLDIDLCGPSIPRLLNLEGRSIHQSPDGWVPVYADPSQNLAVVSIGFLLQDRNDAVVWRGPKKTAMIRQFLTDVCWPQMDYLVIDTPPGTSDEHIAVVETLRKYEPAGAVLVTTPQSVAVGDVRREVTFCRKAGIAILGIVENMSGFVCPSCKDCTNIFSSGGGELLATHSKVPFLGAVPLDPRLSTCSENGENFLEKFPDSPVSSIFKEIVINLESRIG